MLKEEPMVNVEWSIHGIRQRGIAEWIEEVQ
jgi:hypothetical protein